MLYSVVDLYARLVLVDNIESERRKRRRIPTARFIRCCSFLLVSLLLCFFLIFKNHTLTSKHCNCSDCSRNGKSLLYGWGTLCRGNQQQLSSSVGNLVEMKLTIKWLENKTKKKTWKRHTFFCRSPNNAPLKMGEKYVNNRFRYRR